MGVIFMLNKSKSTDNVIKMNAKRVLGLKSN